MQGTHKMVYNNLPTYIAVLVNICERWLKKSQIDNTNTKNNKNKAQQS